MWPNPQDTADLVLFTQGILNGKLHFLWSEVLNRLNKCANISLSLKPGVFRVYH